MCYTLTTRKSIILKSVFSSLHYGFFYGFLFQTLFIRSIFQDLEIIFYEANSKQIFKWLVYHKFNTDRNGILHRMIFFISRMKKSALKKLAFKLYLNLNPNCRQKRWSHLNSVYYYLKETLSQDRLFLKDFRLTTLLRIDLVLLLQSFTI